ncbi:hypothetical protein [Paralysiella testudinis]|uniref:Uncharacterized protein n=1 Tax=Paralysiella testudinis TaxID=2809020 RepID=A0A892ZLS7_9NEIS|nr:hypothetical protein [Paralysiella testudinis]QRQ82534.1 hypothetical protein JQU52_03805 [Paralysiella testudinis]
MKATLLKVKWNQGKTDNGTEYDYTRVLLQVPVYDNAKNEFGHDVMEAEYGLAADHHKLLGLKGKLPMLVEVDIMPQKKGSNIVQVIQRMEPVQPTAKA